MSLNTYSSISACASIILDTLLNISNELYKDAINWHPRFKEFQESFVESYFIKGVQDAYKGDLKRINTMMDVGPTGTTDKLTMVKLNNQNQLLYFFNI